MRLAAKNKSVGKSRLDWGTFTKRLTRRSERKRGSAEASTEMGNAPVRFATRITNREMAADALEEILQAAIEETGAVAGYIMLADAAQTRLTLEVGIGMGTAREFPQERAWGEGMEGQAASLASTRTVPAPEPRDANVLPGGMQGALCVPLRDAASPEETADCAGILVLLRDGRGGFGENEMRTALQLGTQAALVAVSAQVFETQRQAFVEALSALAHSLEARDKYQAGHSYRVAEVCIAIARRLNVAPELVEELRQGALLHDVGKTGVPESVLYNPGRLTEEEFALMRQHPVIGYEMCKPLGLHPRVLMLIRSHHERLDGTGYPDGLKLGELPLLLRIICVADAFDAMSSLRPYRQAIDSRVRNEQLNRFAGSQFDPVIVEALKAIMTAGELNELYKDHWMQEEQADSAPLSNNGGWGATSPPRPTLQDFSKAA